MTESTQKPSSHLIFSIIHTILCCSPFGIYCIYLATKIQGLLNENKIEEATVLAKKNLKINIIGVCVMFVLWSTLSIIMTVGAAKTLDQLQNNPEFIKQVELIQEQQKQLQQQDND